MSHCWVSPDAGSRLSPWQISPATAPTGSLWYDPNTGDTDEWKISNGQWAGSVDLGTHPGSFQFAGAGAFVNANSTSDVLWQAHS